MTALLAFAMGCLCGLWLSAVLWRPRSRRAAHPLRDTTASPPATFESYRPSGFVRPSASAITSLATDARAPIATSLPPRLGLASAAEVGPVTPPWPSKPGAPTFFTDKQADGAATGLTPPDCAA